MIKACDYGKAIYSYIYICICIFVHIFDIRIRSHVDLLKADSCVIVQISWLHTEFFNLLLYIDHVFPLKLLLCIFVANVYTVCRGNENFPLDREPDRNLSLYQVLTRLFNLGFDGG